MKTFFRHITAIMLAVIAVGSLNDAFAQSRRERRRQEKLAEKMKREEEILASVRSFNKDDIFMEYIIENGDTIFIDEIQPTWVFSRPPRGTEWRKYYRLVYNFNKVYPYALASQAIVSSVDRNIEDGNMTRGQRDKYINACQKALLKEFEPVIRKMTISQGKLLVRLVDREIGKSSYEIVKDYKNGIAAGFWQGIAKIFGQNLKSRYDPEGEDRLTEELVKKWEEGRFDQLYYSIFMEWPTHPDVASKYR